MKNNIAKISFILGIVSVFLWEFSIFPILTIILGIIGVTKTKEPETGRWMAVVGIILGTIYLIVRINHGYIER